MPFLVGANAAFRLFMADATSGQLKEQIAYAKKWRIKPNVTKINDGIGGESRDRLNRVVNFFELQADLAVNDAILYNAMMDDIRNDDQSLTPLQKAAGVKLKIPNGSTKAALVLRELIIDDPELVQGGRDTTMAINFAARFRFLDKAPAV